MVEDVATPAFGFERISLAELEALPSTLVDQLPFGVVALTPDGLACLYNETESRLAGISPQNVLGTHYFSGIAQCMNNFMVAQRYEDEEHLDVVLDYVLTLRMRPTPVRLRLLKGPEASRHFLLIQRL